MVAGVPQRAGVQYVEARGRVDPGPQWSEPPPPQVQTRSAPAVKGHFTTPAPVKHGKGRDVELRKAYARGYQAGLRAAAKAARGGRE
jgi:hypothetical protein